MSFNSFLARLFFAEPFVKRKVPFLNAKNVICLWNHTKTPRCLCAWGGLLLGFLRSVKLTASSRQKFDQEARLMIMDVAIKSFKCIWNKAKQTEFKAVNWDHHRVVERVSELRHDIQKLVSTRRGIRCCLNTKQCNGKKIPPRVGMRIKGSFELTMNAFNKSIGNQVIDFCSKMSE